MPAITALFSPRVAMLRSLINTDAQLATDWYRFVSAKQAALQDPAQWLTRLEHELERARTLGANRWLRYGNSLRELSNQLVKQAFVRTVAGETVPNQAELELAAHVFAAPEWRGQGYTQKPREWATDLWTGDMAHNMALWLSWTHSNLPQNTREDWQRSLVSHGLQPILDDWVNVGTRIHALDSMGHNWWSVIVAGAGVAAVVAGEQYKALAIRDNLLAWLEYKGGLLQNKSRTFGADGGFIETPAYCDYALHNYLTFAFAWQQLTGDNALLTHPSLQGLPDWYLAHCYPIPQMQKWRYVNFGDCHLNIERGGVWLGLSHALGDRRMLQAFHAAKLRPTNVTDFLWYSAPESAATGAPDGAPVSADDNTPDSAPDVTAKADAPLFAENAVFNDAGVAFLRSNNGDHLLAIRAGEVWNHNHLDSGTFVFYSGGKEWIGDPGTCSYSRSEYNSYMVQPQAHNIVVKDGKGVPDNRRYHGTHFNATFPVFWRNGDYRYLLADLNGPYIGVYERNFRHVLWIDSQAAILIDDLATQEPAHFSYMLHPEGDLVANGAEGCFRVEREGDARAVSVFASQPVSVDTQPGWYIGLHDTVREDHPLPSRPYYSFSTQQAQTRAKFVSVMGFSAHVEAKLVRRNNTLLELQMSTPEKEWVIWINEEADGRAMHRNSWQAWGDVETDAFIITWCRTDGRTFLHNGSYLRQAGRPLFESWQKTNGTLCASLQV